MSLHGPERNVRPGSEDRAATKFYLRFPPNWATMTRDGQKAVTLAMAKDAERQLGIRPER
jgi:hypothetical protein